MKALITGVNGFVGRYLKEELARNGYQVTGTGLEPSSGGQVPCDLLDENAIGDVIGAAEPDGIFHLAGQSSVAKSWQQPALTFDVNVHGTINLLEAVKKRRKQARVVIIGSSDQYGATQSPGGVVKETDPLCPDSPYAVSKCAQELMGGIYAKSLGMDIVMTRSFNHIGAGQGMGFVIPDLSCGIAQIELGLRQELLVGNLSAKRDFTDVRDVARAYRLVFEKGLRGEVYNVGSGIPWKIEDLLDRLVAMAKRPIKVTADPSKFRPVDTPVVQCDYGKLNKDTGWSPRINILETLEEVLDYYRTVLPDGKA